MDGHAVQRFVAGSAADDLGKTLQRACHDVVMVFEDNLCRSLSNS